MVTGALLAILATGSGLAQEPARAVLRGQVLRNGEPYPAGPVVLHHVSSDAQGEIDSIAPGPDGSFSARLPNVPDPERGDVYFASVRYSGILYFGRAITLPVELDSLYTIEVYDTASVGAEGANFTIQVRNTFLEQNDGVWAVTDLFQIRHDGDRTLIAPDGGVVWRYPLAVGARDPEVASEGSNFQAVDFADGNLQIRSAVPPGERLIAVRYFVADPFLELPMPGRTENMELLVREPAPALEMDLLQPMEPVEIEAGTTYRRFSGANLAGTVLRLREGQGTGGFPVEWMAVILALVLTGFGVMAASRGTAPVPVPVPTTDATRQSLILEVARMDEAFEALPAPTDAEREAYERRRRELIRRLKALG